MKAQPTRPTLSVGNHIYLYRLLSQAIGCGKQTLSPKVEEALAAERMTAEDLGFESTRDLLEELDDFIQLTVFKGGRIYATVIAQPAWDEALAAPEKAAKTAKSFKRKKVDKGLKPVRPRRVKRPAPVPAPEPAGTTEAENASNSDVPAAEPESAATTAEASQKPETLDGAADASAPTDGEKDVAEPAEVAEAPIQAADQTVADAETQDAPVADDGSPAEAKEPEAAKATEAQTSETPDITESAKPAAQENDEARPAIKLTVIYDPEHANAGITTLESTPGISPSEVEQAIRPQCDSNEANSRPAAKTAVADSAVEPAPAKAAEPDSTPAKTVAETAHPAPEPVSAPEPVAETQTASQAVAQAAAPAADTPDAAPRHVAIPERKRAPEQGGFSRRRSDGPRARRTHVVHGNPVHPTAMKPAPAPAPTAKPAEKPQASSAPEELPDGFPRDFATDVYCPSVQLSRLSQLLPLGADVMGILTEYLYIAQLRGTLKATRNRGSFPMGYTREGKRHHALVTIRRTTGGRGAAWAVDRVEEDIDRSE